MDSREQLGRPAALGFGPDSGGLELIAQQGLGLADHRGLGLDAHERGLGPVRNDRGLGLFYRGAHGRPWYLLFVHDRGLGLRPGTFPSERPSLSPTSAWEATPLPPDLAGDSSPSKRPGTWRRPVSSGSRHSARPGTLRRSRPGTLRPASPLTRCPARSKTRHPATPNLVDQPGLRLFAQRGLEPVGRHLVTSRLFAHRGLGVVDERALGHAADEPRNSGLLCYRV